MRRLIGNAALALIGLLALPPSTQARPGDLDPSFSRDGRLFARAFDNHVNDLEVDSSGRMLVAFDGGVIRLMPDGSPDRSFGTRGSVRLPDGVEADEIQLDAADRIVGGALVRYPDNEYTFFRLLSDGSFDGSFGAGQGVVRMDAGGLSNEFFTMGVSADDRIVFTGTVFEPGTRVAVTRLLPDGSLDPSFSGDGRTTVSPSGGRAVHTIVAHGLAIEPSGSVVIGGGWAADESGATCGVFYSVESFVMRLDGSGELDPAFGRNGVAHPDLGRDSDYVESVALRPDGRLVITGERCDDGPRGGNQGFVGQLDRDGGFDSSFAGRGYRLPSPRNGLVLQPNGKIITAGRVANGPTGSDLALRRFSADGDFDRSFAGGGLVTTDLAFDAQYLDGVALAPDGRILAIGFTGQPGKRGFLITRYLNSGKRADADADGTPDDADRCFLRFARRPSGCPPPAGGRLTASIKRYQANGDVIAHGRVESRDRGCSARRRITIVRLRDRGHDIVGSAQTKYGGAFQWFEAPSDQAGRYVAIAPGFVDPRVGRCKALRSRAVHLPAAD